MRRATTLFVLVLAVAATSVAVGGPISVELGESSSSGGCHCVAWKETFLHEFICGFPARRLSPGQTYRRDGGSQAAAVRPIYACGRWWMPLRLDGEDETVFWVKTARRRVAFARWDGEDGFGDCVCQAGPELLLSQVTAPSSQLLSCLCIVESNCNLTIGCRWDMGSDSCGPYQIKLPYWQDASDFAGRALGGDWKSCTTGANNKACSVETVQYYLSRYAKRCVGPQREPTDEDYARIHNGGPLGCRNPNTLPYWKRVQACLGNFE